MDNTSVSPNDGHTSNASPRVAGMPTIEELKRRVLVRAQEKEKKRSGRKNRRDLSE